MHRDGADAGLLEHFGELDALMLPLSQPRRIFAVTGTLTARTTASAMRAAFSGSFISALPSPFLTTLAPRGQPHVDIQDVRAGNFDRHLRSLGHAVHIAAKDLRGKRLFARKRTKQLRGLRVVVAQRLALTSSVTV